MCNGEYSTAKDTNEYFISVHITEAASPEEAFEKLHASYMQQCAQKKLTADTEIFVRIFCSDIRNHTILCDQIWPQSASSIRIYIGQAPLDSRYCSLQAYHIQSKNIVKKHLDAHTLRVCHGAYTSLHHLALPTAQANAYTQSNDVIGQMLVALHNEAMNLEEHCLRTWYYVRDIDNNYSAMVQSRTELYEPRGLTPATHFTASTGIQSCAPDPFALVWLQTWGIKGLKQQQVRYLKALEHLSPTALYGVNFERATHVTYGDREHCLISGTASIDKYGEIVHENDVPKQLERTIENIQALLHEGGMTLADMRGIIVYLRDAHEYPRIQAQLANIFSQHCAINVVDGAVCRPGWRIEIEGVAIKPAHHPDLAAFC